MGAGVGVALLAVGAILTWATNFKVAGIELGTVGIILMIAGAIALVAGMVRGPGYTVVRERREL